MSLLFAPYSFSRISTFMSCPKKFEFSYILKPKIEEKPQIALQKGSYIHHCLELYPTAPSAFFNLNQEQIEEYNGIIKNYLNSEINIKILSEICIGKEIDFGLTKDFKMCNFNNSSALMRGSIDRLNMHGNNQDKLHVIDYKSGKAKEEKFQSYMQIMLYAIWIFRNPVFSTVQEVLGSYVYVEHNKINSKIFYRNELFYYIEEYIKIIKNVEQAGKTNIFPKKETKLCDWCDYKKMCNAENLIFV